MAIKRKDFQKAAAFIHEFLLKLNEESECAELRDTLNLALLHMQKYYRMLQTRLQEKSAQAMTLSLTARGLSPMTPFVDAPDKFQWKWLNLDSLRSVMGACTEESINLTTLPPLIQAVREGDLQTVKDYIEQDISCVEEQDGIGRTALVYAVHFQHLDILRCLLESAININATAHDGSTAMHQACHDNNDLALRTLLQYGGDFTIQDTQGRAPIHWAVTTRSTECLKYLIGHYADVNVRDKDGLSPCMWACRLDHIKHFELLSSSPNFQVEEADGIERDNSGRTWMHWSIRKSEPLECLQTLLTKDTADIKDEDGKTVLLLAAEMGSLLACKIIIEIAGRECIVVTDVNGRTALHLAAMGGHGDIVNYLLDQGADLYAVDKFNANAWDYAKNRQLHYCQLIIMSHQRQRLQSNPTSPVLNGLGLSLMSSNVFMNNVPQMNGGPRSVNGDTDYDHMINTSSSFENTPMTPPHPPKRPRTARTPLRRSHSMLSAPEREPSFHQQHPDDERFTSSAGGELQSRRKERIDVMANHNPTSEAFPREEVNMALDEPQPAVEDEEIDNVSVGGMDVSDIDDEDDKERIIGRGPRGPPGHTQSMQQHQQQPKASTQVPRPPVRGKFQPQPPKHAQTIESSYRRRSQEYTHDEFEDQDRREGGLLDKHQPAPPPPKPLNTRVISPHFQQSSNPSESFPPGKPRPAPRHSSQPPNSRQPRPPQRLSPPPGRPTSGSRDYVHSPPSSEQKYGVPEANRPSSGSKPPGMVEGRKIAKAPPPMLTPLENAPQPPSQGEIERREKKKKKRKKAREREREQERESELKSPPLELQPFRGHAAPLHPPPSATQRRVPSGIPAPRYSKQTPQRHEPRYVDENMEDDKEEDNTPPVVNGFAVPVKESPTRPTNYPGHHAPPPMESEDYYDVGPNGDAPMQEAAHESAEEENEGVGPLIPPPQGFRGQSSRSGRPLSQSIPQDSRSTRMVPTSAKPPLPSGRASSSSVGRHSGRKSPSPSRRRPPTGRSHSSS